MISHDQVVSAWKAQREIQSKHNQMAAAWYQHHKAEYDRMDDTAGWSALAIIGFISFILAPPVLFLNSFFTVGLSIAAVSFAAIIFAGWKFVVKGKKAEQFKAQHNPTYALTAALFSAKNNFLEACAKEVREMGLNIEKQNFREMSFTTDRGEVTVAFEPDQPEDPKFLLEGKVIMVNYREDRRKMLTITGDVINVDKEPVSIV